MSEIAWRSMKDAPTDTTIVARHEPNKNMPHGWIGTIRCAFDDPDEDRRGGLDTILHYNGYVLVSGFHGMWTGWMYPEEFASLHTSEDLASAEAAAHAKGRAEGIREAAEIADGWLQFFGTREPEHITAQQWANDAVRDIAELIRELPTTGDSDERR